MSSRRILVIEDDEQIAEILVRGLEIKGFEVTVAGGGQSGREYWATGAFDLVLLDVMLPEIDGISLCAERRAAGGTTPVILLTARHEEEMRDRGLAAGANDYISKPFAYADLMACIQRLTDERHDRFIRPPPPPGHEFNDGRVVRRWNPVEHDE